MTGGALSITDTAKYLGVSRRTVERLSQECGAREPELVPVRIGGRRVFRVVDLDRFLERHLTTTRRSA